MATLAWAAPTALAVAAAVGGLIYLTIDKTLHVEMKPVRVDPPRRPEARDR